MKKSAVGVLRDNLAKVERLRQQNVERQGALKLRRNAAGFRQLQEWVHDEDREALKNYARCLRARRFEILEGRS